MAKAETPRIGGWKFVFMLLITWLTWFSGLGNLIFLWNDLHYRKRAAIALGVGLGAAVIPHATLVSTQGWLFGHIFEAVQLGMDIWMTFDAISAYKKYRPAARAAAESKPAVPAAAKGKPAKPRQTRTPAKSVRKKS